MVSFVFVDGSYRYNIVYYLSKIENIIIAGSFAGSFEPLHGASSGVSFPWFRAGSHTYSIWFLMADVFRSPYFDGSYRYNIVYYLSKIENIVIVGSFSGSFGTLLLGHLGDFLPSVSHGSHICSIWFLGRTLFIYVYWEMSRISCEWVIYGLYQCEGGWSYGFADVLHIGLYDSVSYVFIYWSYRLYIINYFSSIENIFFARSFSGSFGPPSGVYSGTSYPGISRGSHICSIWFIMAEPFSYTFISWNETDIESNGHIGSILCIICRKGWEHGLLSGSFGPPSGVSSGVFWSPLRGLLSGIFGEKVPRDFARFSHISFMILLSEVVLSPFSMRHIPIILSIICRWLRTWYL